VRKTHLVLILCFVFLTGCSLAGDFTPPPSISTSQAAQPVIEPTAPQIPTPTTASESVSVMSPSPERGASIYTENCAACHGESGLGDGSHASSLPIPASPIGDPEFARTASPGAWVGVVTEGRIDRFMPGFESLSDAERWDVVAYALSLSSRPMDVTRGEEIFAGVCTDCHGSDGAGTETAPDLTRFEWISQRSLDQITTTIGEGISPGMPAFADALVEDERVAVARFVFDLSFPGTDFHPAENASISGEDAVIEAKISGQISNGTDGGNVPGGIEVTLYGFDGQQQTLTEKTIASDSGEYFFEDVEIQPGRVFVTAVEYQGATYGSEVVHIGEEFELDLPITVYESTADLSQLRVDRLHLIFDMPSEGVLQVTELWILSNLGDRTVATQAGEGIFSVQLPENAANLGFEGGTSSTRFQQSTETNGFIDLLPIRPGMGSHEIVFSFNLLFESTLDFSQSMAYPVEAIIMLAPQGVVELEGAGIEDLGLRQMSGAALRNYSAGPISSGEELEVRVKREKTSQAVSEESKNTIEIVVGTGLFIIALAATGFWLDRRLQKREAGSESMPMELDADETAGDERLDRERILQELADLDDAYEVGEIDDHSYEKQRKDLKDQLMEVL